MQIKSAEFLLSSSKAEGCPRETLPEIAFIGRSNVGKSSLINMLAQRKSLAKTSSTPGKTKLINHFLINKAWYLVDLPGYGYAKASKGEKSGFQKLVGSYFQARRPLHTFLLIDIRHLPLPVDLRFMSFLTELGSGFSLIFTKADKLKPNEIGQYTERYTERLRAVSVGELPGFLVSSAAKGWGREVVLAYIDDLLRENP